MKLSPASVFLGIVAFGLPFAVTIGWTMGAVHPVIEPGRPAAGAGAIGTAPPQLVPSVQSTVAGWPSGSAAPQLVTVRVPQRSAVPSPAAAPVVATSAPAPTLRPTSAPPPAPTPTTPSPAPTVEPSESPASPEPTATP